MDPADDILAILQVCVCFFLGWFYVKTFCPFCQKVGCWWSPGMDKKVTSPASLGLPRLARLLEGRNGHVLALEHIEERKIISSPETQTQMSENMGKRTAGMFLSSALLGLLQKHLLFLSWMVVVFQTYTPWRTHCSLTVVEDEFTFGWPPRVYVSWSVPAISCASWILLASFRPDGMVSQGACVWGAEECFQTTSGSRHNLKNRKAVSVCQGA